MVDERLGIGRVNCVGQNPTDTHVLQRAGPEGDSVCAKERSALAACAGRQARMPRNTAQEKRQVVRQLQVRQGFAVDEYRCRAQAYPPVSASLICSMVLRCKCALSFSQQTLVSAWKRFGY